MKKKIWNNKGMITVEAAFLIPFSIMIIMVLVWMGFLQYNRNVMTQAASMAVMEASYFADLDNDELLEKMIKRFEELVRDNLVCVEDLQVEGEVKYSEITLTVTGEMEVPGIVFLTDGYTTGPWDLSVEKSASRVRKSMVVRTIKIASDYLHREE